MHELQDLAVLRCTGCGAVSNALDLAHADGVCPVCGSAATVPAVAVAVPA
jgi:rRNA maturation endonuclease Nob1